MNHVQQLLTPNCTNAFEFLAWQSPAVYNWTSETPYKDGKIDLSVWHAQATRHADMVMGRPITKWNDGIRGPQTAAQLKGHMAMLDVEVYGDKLFDACYAYKEQNPHGKLTTFGLANVLGNVPDPNLLLTSNDQQHRDYFRRLSQFNAFVGADGKPVKHFHRLRDVLDVIPLGYYFMQNRGDPNDARDLPQQLLILSRLIDIAQLAIPNKPLGITFWTRMLFTDVPQADGTTLNTDIPSQFLPECLRVASRVITETGGIISVFDLQSTDTVAINTLKNYV